MKQAIMIGAGNIGRGFIGALLEKSGYHVTFADVAENLISAINERGSYTVHIQDREQDQWTVTNISGISSAGPELAEAIAGDCDIITTAVGLRILPIVAKPIAAGIQARKARRSTQILNIVACENAIRGTSQLRESVYSHLSEEEQAYAREYVGFADCAVDRIVPKASFENPLDVAVEQYTEWDVEKGGWKGELPDIQGLGWVDNLDAYLERKLFTLNSGHAICAYLGTLKGYRTIVESIADPAIGALVRQAMYESGEGLIRKFGFDADAHHAYIERIFARFQNPFLADETQRVAREPIRKLAPTDRLVKPLMTAYSYGLPVDHLIFGAAAALHFSCPEDEQSTQLMETIETKGVEKALEEYTGLKPQEPLFGRILDVYRALSLCKK
ncbi:mannitol-1-phosphate 5-dehydrogenase [Colidextribacter sp. OB.20]|uniref:mannitol-1-phosphate 5-dehydrogenase n=1 Tax=Colidextribacter sp. OB.20 TaxID=2304568 RepID=UPI00136979E1|nr:mannitol-1-phosphate 5-dehydrogenase [Colidextribacter sp. OB.20]NBI09928.1 mannitol-1-phosphate 5-dehydrogenase [Colidextribacter sp. OB.20]